MVGERPFEVGDCLSLSLMQPRLDLVLQNSPAPAILDRGAGVPEPHRIFFQLLQKQAIVPQGIYATACGTNSPVPRFADARRKPFGPEQPVRRWRGEACLAAPDIAPCQSGPSYSP